MGRKALGDDGKTHMLRVRMTMAERADIDQAAAVAGVSTSAWVRDLILAAANVARPVAKTTVKPKRTRG